MSGSTEPFDIDAAIIARLDRLQRLKNQQPQQRAQPESACRPAQPEEDLDAATSTDAMQL